MVRDALGPSAFFGKGAPGVIMTDNCDALTNALKKTWPSSQLFLCIFHILQQVGVLEIQRFTVMLFMYIEVAWIT